MQPCQQGMHCILRWMRSLRPPYIKGAFVSLFWCFIAAVSLLESFDRIGLLGGVRVEYFQLELWRNWAKMSLSHITFLLLLVLLLLVLSCPDSHQQSSSEYLEAAIFRHKQASLFSRDPLEIILHHLKNQNISVPSMKISNIPHFATCECDGEIEESARGGILGQHWLAQIWKGGKVFTSEGGNGVDSTSRRSWNGFTRVAVEATSI